MKLTIDDVLLRNIDITPEQARLDLAVGLYIDRRIGFPRGVHATTTPSAA